MVTQIILKLLGLRYWVFVVQWYMQIQRLFIWRYILLCQHEDQYGQNNLCLSMVTYRPSSRAASIIFYSSVHAH